MILVREAGEGDAAGIAPVHVESWKSTYRGLVPDDYLNSLDISSRTQDFQNWLKGPPDRFLSVAENLEGEIVGFVSGGPVREKSGPEMGELYAIYFLSGYQRKGIGRKLFYAGADRLKHLGYRRMVLYSLAGNPHQAFYTALGGREEPAAKKIQIGGMTFRLALYSWVL